MNGYCLFAPIGGDVDRFLASVGVEGEAERGKSQRVQISAVELMIQVQVLGSKHHIILNLGLEELRCPRGKNTDRGTVACRYQRAPGELPS